MEFTIQNYKNKTKQKDQVESTWSFFIFYLVLLRQPRIEWS